MKTLNEIIEKQVEEIMVTPLGKLQGRIFQALRDIAHGRDGEGGETILCMKKCTKCDCILCNCFSERISCCIYRAVEEKKKVKELCDICTKKCLPILKENPGLRAYEYCMNGLCRHIHTDIFGDNGTNG